MQKNLFCLCTVLNERQNKARKCPKDIMPSENNLLQLQQALYL